MSHFHLLFLFFHWVNIWEADSKKIKFGIPLPSAAIYRVEMTSLSSSIFTGLQLADVELDERISSLEENGGGGGGSQNGNIN